MKARPLEEWHDDVGPVLWWRFPVDEPPYSGSPLDADWPGYHTHWTPIVVPVDDDAGLRGLWTANGGSFHGPNVETGTIPETRLLALLSALGAGDANTRLKLECERLRQEVKLEQSQATAWFQTSTAHVREVDRLRTVLGRIAKKKPASHYAEAYKTNEQMLVECAAIASAAIAGTAETGSKAGPANWPIQSFDCDDWAREFVRLHGGDVDLMRTWFAAALMRGYDEYRWRQAASAGTACCWPNCWCKAQCDVTRGPVPTSRPAAPASAPLCKCGRLTPAPGLACQWCGERAPIRPTRG